MTKHKIYTTSVASVYRHYVVKAEKKGRTKAEVDEIICWLTGYSQKAHEANLENETDFETFFDQAPQLNPSRTLIRGVVCGVRVEDIKEPIMREIRYLDKLIDELAKGKSMEKILRSSATEIIKSSSPKRKVMSAQSKANLGSFEDLLHANSEVNAIALALRESIFKAFPETVEVVRLGDGAASYGIGQKKNSESYVYIMPKAGYVNLGFFFATQLKDPDKLLEGTGKKMRHVKVRSLQEVSHPALKQLVADAYAERKHALATKDEKL